MVTVMMVERNENSLPISPCCSACARWCASPTNDTQSVSRFRDKVRRLCLILDTNLPRVVMRRDVGRAPFPK
jgi:hypothetical protein